MDQLRRLTPRGAGPSAGCQAAQGGQGTEASAAGLRAAHGRELEVRFSGPPGVLPRGPQRRGRDCQPLACAGATHGGPGVMGPSCGWALAQADWARSEAVQAGSGPGQAGARGPLCPAGREQACDAWLRNLGVLGICAQATIFCPWDPVEGAELEAMGTQRFSPGAWSGSWPGLGWCTCLARLVEAWSGGAVSQRHRAGSPWETGCPLGP